MEPNENKQLPTDAQVEQEKLEQEYMMDTGSVIRTKGRHAIHCLTVVGLIEGHVSADQSQKVTKYEHVIPQLVAIEEDPDIEALLVILNTVGGDVEAGLALSELISGVSKPSATLVLGGGHSIGIPLAVSAKRCMIAPTASMTIHPVRMTGVVVGAPQTYQYFNRIQEQIVDFVTANSRISRETFLHYMMATGEIATDVGSVVYGREAVQVGLVDQLGSVGDALDYLHQEIERRKQPKAQTQSNVDQ